MAADIDALNYPYIRIRDVNWLKRTLLVFPHVARIVPEFNRPLDLPEIDRFCWLEGRRGPLLRPANLYTGGVRRAQDDLILQIRERMEVDPQFIETYGAPSGGYRPSYSHQNLDVWDIRRDAQHFQLARTKMTYELAYFLLDHHLAWQTPFADGPDYVEMDRRLGEAVMATIAYACAEDDGLELVTEFPNVFGRTINQPKDVIFDACLDGKVDHLHRPADELAEFIVYQRCDPNKLTPESLLALNHEWGALAAFKDALDAAALTLPTIMADEASRSERLHDIVNDIFRKWEDDRLNLSSYCRQLFGDGVLSEPKKLVEEVTKAAFAPALGGGAARSLDKDVFLGAAAGFAIGVAVRAGTALVAARKTERQSPFRYLTLMQENGVGFVLSK